MKPDQYRAFQEGWNAGEEYGRSLLTDTTIAGALFLFSLSGFAMGVFIAQTFL